MAHAEAEKQEHAVAGIQSEKRQVQEVRERAQEKLVFSLRSFGNDFALYPGVRWEPLKGFEQRSYKI